MDIDRTAAIRNKKVNLFYRLKDELAKVEEKKEAIEKQLAQLMVEIKELA